MPKRTDLQSVLILGSGPIDIGQAAEFDYSGTQAVWALREEGYRVILVNSNPATIMTTPDLADATYICPYRCIPVEHGDRTFRDAYRRHLVRALPLLIRVRFTLMNDRFR